MFLSGNAKEPLLTIHRNAGHDGPFEAGTQLMCATYLQGQHWRGQI